VISSACTERAPHCRDRHPTRRHVAHAVGQLVGRHDTVLPGEPSYHRAVLSDGVRAVATLTNDNVPWSDLAA
jgi:hypothetical protein